jgi:predicted SprT family Zn-dependent metalloprotease
MYDEEEDFNNEDDKLPSTSDDGKLNFEDREKSTGVVYLSTVPQQFNAKKVRDALSSFGEIGRIFLQVNLLS